MAVVNSLNKSKKVGLILCGLIVFLCLLYFWDNKKHELSTVHFTFAESGIPVLTVQIDSDEIEAWLDLGRGKSLVRSDSFPVKSYTKTGHLMKTQSFNDLPKDSEEIEISQITIENLHFNNVKSVLGPSGRVYYEFTADGTTEEKRTVYPNLIIGNEIFRNGELMIDYDRQSITYSNRPFFASMYTFLSDWISVPFEINHGTIVLSGYFNGELHGFVLDTGFSLNIISKEDNSDDHKLISIEHQDLYLGAKKVVLEDVVETNRPLKPGIIGILGTPFFHDYQVLIDFPNRYVYLRPYEPMSD